MLHSPSQCKLAHIAEGFNGQVWMWIWTLSRLRSISLTSAACCYTSIIARGVINSDFNEGGEESGGRANRLRLLSSRGTADPYFMSLFRLSRTFGRDSQIIDRCITPKGRDCCRHTFSHTIILEVTQLRGWGGNNLACFKILVGGRGEVGRPNTL